MKRLFLKFLRYLFKSEKHLKFGIIIFVLLVSGMLFYKYLVLILFVLVGAGSLIHTIWTKNYLGFELCTLVTVVCAIKFGAVIGALVGMLAVTLGLILSINVDAGIFLAAFMFAIIGVISSFFSFDTILVAGMISVVVYDIVILSFYTMTGSSPVTSALYFVTHLLTTYYIFDLIAPLFIVMLG
jgi:hypothetical protein